MRKTFYSHGKLLITAEYLVLDDTDAIAIPTKKGQWLTVEDNDLDHINWKSFDEKGNCWFQTTLVIENNKLKNLYLITEKKTLAEVNIIETLLKILTSAIKLNPEFLLVSKGYTIETNLEFNPKWGLGSSSTLINNIAKWAEIDAFKLLELSFGGSGYDIACAQHNEPIIFNRNNGIPRVKKICFSPPFKNNIFFIHLNRKQDSKESIRHYRSLSIKDYEASKKSIEIINAKILNCLTLDTFNFLLNSHELIISDIIKMPTIKSQLFPDYPKSIKSLGGWGGDFILVTGSIQEMDYFKSKGYTTILSYSEMVL